MTKKALLKDQAYESLKSLILEGDFAPGSFLSERQLAAKLNMSKTPIRTALERLEIERFIVISPQQGIVVRELSLQEINDHYDIRLALETFVVRRLAGNLSAAQLAELRENIAAMQDANERGSRADFIRCDADFHLLLCNYLGNHEILRVMQHQRDKLYHVIRRLIERNAKRLSDTVQEHSAIVNALEAGDSAQAAAEIEAHLNNGRRLLVL